MGSGRTQLFGRGADNRRMKITIICAVLALAACSTKANPDACCTTQQQCDALGLSGMTSCKAGNVCNGEGACVASECTTSPDCTSPDKPVCINHLCVAKCSVDDDCNGLAGTPHCGGDGVCVACVDDTQCTATAPVCDSSSHACRGCSADSECPEGVCLEAQGQCVAQSDVIFVRAGGTDSGTCPSSAPCASLHYAFQQITGARNIVHIVGTTLNTGTTSTSLPPQMSVYVDGEGTTLQYGGSSGAVFTVGSGTAQFSNVTVGTIGITAFSITGGTLDLFATTLKGPVTITGGALDIAQSELSVSNNLAVQCTNGGAVSIRRSKVHSKVTATDCPMTLQQNRFDATAGAFTIGGNAVSIVENNVITSTDYITDAAYVGGLTGSRVRFNSFVNVSGVDMGAMTLSCNAAVDVSSNIFAWHSSTAPSSCSATYSLFDSVVGLQPGSGNRVGDASTFFVDLQGGDFHLSAASPAIDGAEPGQDVSVDLDGSPRPNGSASDIGAYETH